MELISFKEYEQGLANLSVFASDEVFRAATDLNRYVMNRRAFSRKEFSDLYSSLIAAMRIEVLPRTHLRQDEINTRLGLDSELKISAANIEIEVEIPEHEQEKPEG